MTKTDHEINNKRKGFVLIIGLSLLMFCAALGYSLFFFSRTHISLAQSQNAHYISQQNATLALNIAIARIQTAIQSNYYATVQSDTLGQPSLYNGWTGALAQNGKIIWLVSGDTPDPAIPLDRSNSKILFNSAKEKMITVPTEIIFDHKKQEVGEFAYVVIDQSTKASLQRFKNNPLPTTLAFKEIAEQRALQTTSHWWYDSAFCEQYEQLPLFARNIPKSYFHDICRKNNYTPIDLQTGRIKQILNPLNPPKENHGFLLTDAIVSFLSQNVDNNDNAYFILPSDSSISTQVTSVHQQIPIITECGIYITARKSTQTGDADLSLYIRIRTELWNPYAFPLTIPAEARKWKIQVDGLNDLTVAWKTNNGTNHSESKKINLSKAFRDSEIYMKNLPTSIPAGGVLVRNSDIKIDLNAMAIGCTRSKDYISLSSPKTKLSFNFKTEDDSSIASFKDIPFDPLNSDRYSLHKLSSSKVFDEYDNYTTLYHFSRKDELTPPQDRTLSDLERWFLEADFRENHVLLSADSPIAQLFNISKDPAFAYDVESDPFSGGQFFYAPIFDDPKRQFRVFDATAIYPRTLSHLQHLQIKNMPAFSIGNPHGKEWNRFFDIYFPDLPFEYLEQNSLTQKIRYNHDISLEEGNDFHQSYQICGAFNLNSCSVFAWKTMLQGFSTKSWTYRTFHKQERSLSRENLTHGFFRLRHGADRLTKHPSEDFPSYPDWENKDSLEWMYLQQGIPWFGAYSFAAREISEKEINELSKEIVSQIKTYGKGFFSISDFLNSAVLQKRLIKRVSIH